MAPSERPAGRLSVVMNRRVARVRILLGEQIKLMAGSLAGPLGEASGRLGAFNLHSEIINLWLLSPFAFACRARPSICSLSLSLSGFICWPVLSEQFRPAEGARRESEREKRVVLLCGAAHLQRPRRPSAGRGPNPNRADEASATTTTTAQNGTILRRALSIIIFRHYSFMRQLARSLAAEGPLGAQRRLAIKWAHEAGGRAGGGQ